MVIHDVDGQPMGVTSDGRANVVSVVQTDLNALGALGKAWSLPFKQAALNTSDNAVFHIKNTSDDDLDIMKLWVSASGAGLWSLAYNRTYTSGGTAITLRQFNTLSGKTQDLTAYYGQALTLGGTATDLAYFRIAANTPVDLLNFGPVILPPSGTFHIRFQADAGTPTMAVTPILHGTNPWEV